MTTTMYDGDKFERGGREFVLAIRHDADHEPPWEEADGHGVVSEWTSRKKRSGERVLASDRSRRRFYDFAETTRVAKKDSWGLGRDAEAELAQKLGREPTRGEIVRESVTRDYDHLRRWCNDDWHWVGVVVKEDETGEVESLWGIESDADDYLAEVARELADELNHRLGEKAEEEEKADA